MFVTLLHIIIFQFPPILRNSMIYVLNGYGSQNNDHCQHVPKEQDVVNPDESTNDRQYSRLRGPAKFADDFFFRNLNGRKRRVYVNMSLLLFHLNTGLNLDGFAFSVFHQITYAFRKAYRPECSSGNSEQAESALHGDRIARMIVQLFASYPEILPDFDEHFPLY